MSGDLRLSCAPNREGNLLVFPYAIENAGGADVYVMHALPAVDARARTARADDQAAVVILGPEDDAVLGKFIAPLPEDRRVAMPTVPLARRLPPGGRLEARLCLPMPLAETGPYSPDLPLRQYEPLELRGVLFTIGYWVAGSDGLAALPVPYAPELYSVVTRNTAASARQAAQRFPTQRLQLLKRTDRFARNLGAGWRPTAAEGELLASGVRPAGMRQG